MAKAQALKVVDLDLEAQHKAELMDFLGYDKETNVFPYVPKIYRTLFPEDKSRWAVFTLRGKDGITYAQTEDDVGMLAMDDKGVVSGFKTMSGTQRLKILRDGVVGWKNFFDGAGNEIQFVPIAGKQTISDNSLRFLKPKLQEELVNAINERSVLTDEELLGLKY